MGDFSETASATLIWRPTTTITLARALVFGKTVLMDEQLVRWTSSCANICSMS
jgi:hypothetical protein